jgi:hypothetical protein
MWIQGSVDWMCDREKTSGVTSDVDVWPGLAWPLPMGKLP